MLVEIGRYHYNMPVRVSQSTQYGTIPLNPFKQLLQVLAVNRQFIRLRVAHTIEDEQFTVFTVEATYECNQENKIDDMSLELLLNKWYHLEH